MEMFSSKGSVLLGYSPPRSFAAASSSSSSFSDAVVDFHDVFGGPPRRVSIQERRYSFNSDGVEDGVGRGGIDEKVERRRSPWGGGLGFGEKPVFGETSSGAQRSRNTSDDFFDDIFRGGNSSDSPGAGATLKKREFYSSSVPADAILIPRSDVFGGSSVATQSSVPDKVGKGMEVPVFTSVSSSARRSRDNYPPSPTLSSSRLSRHGSQSQNDLTNEAQLFYRQSPLSVEFSFANDGSVKVTKTDKVDGEDILKQNSTISDSLVNRNQFHFSIYKWASKGAPPMIPIRGGVNFRLRDKSTKKSLNDDRKQEADGETEQVVEDEVAASLWDTALKDSSSSRRNMKKKDDERISTMDGEGVVDEDSNPNVDEKEATVRVPIPSIEPVNIVKNISDDFNYHEIRARSKTRVVADIVNDEDEEETTGSERENQKSGLTTAINENEGQADSQTILEAGAKPKGTTLFSRFASLGSYIKKQDTKGTISDTNSDVDKTSVPSSPGESSRRRKVKEKVKEFVEMFNHDSSFKSKMDADISTQSSEWNDKSIKNSDGGVSVSTKRTGKDIPKPKLDQKFELSNAPEMVDKKIKQEAMSTLVHKKKMSPITSAKVENDTMSPKAKKDMTHITGNVVDRKIKSTAASITVQKKETFASSIEDKKIATATKVNMDSVQPKKSSSQVADISKDPNMSFSSRTERKREAYRNDSPMESKRTDPSSSYKVDEKADGFKKKEKEDFRKESGSTVRKETCSTQKDVSSLGTGSSLPDLYQDANESLLDPIDAFEIKELTEELSNVSEMDEYQLALQESDDKIRKWSRGKEGNIRSLLSTLQHVLWPGSGWKPVALMDIIEANQVKRTYQRALLCLHPDKLQQKGAAEHQKYIAGKVFDILQESWNHFNTLTSL